jgi:hypothetical protein
LAAKEGKEKDKREQHQTQSSKIRIERDQNQKRKGTTNYHQGHQHMKECVCASKIKHQS